MKKLFAISIAIAACLLPMAAQSTDKAANPLITDGLVAFLPFNGDGKDASGNGSDLDASALSFDTDRFGREEMSLRLAGDAVDTGIAERGSISLWLRLDDAGPMGILSAGMGVGESDGFELATFVEKSLYAGYGHSALPFLSENRGLVFYSSAIASKDNPAIVVPTKVIFDKKWHHLVLGWNGDVRLAIWLDGKPVSGAFFGYAPYQGEAEVSDVKKSPFVLKVAPRSSASTLLLGAVRATDPKYPSPFSKLNGAIDDLRVYSRILKDSEVQTLFKEDKAK